jgi:quinol monooxygenase YgiN
VADVVVIVNLSVKPDRRESVIEHLKATAAASHGEAGCRLFAVHEDAEQPDRVVLIERWDSEDALEAHHHEPHMVDLPQFLAENMTGEPGRQFLTAIPAGEAGKGTL